MTLDRTRAILGSLAAMAGLGASFAYTELRTHRAKQQHPPVGRFLEVDGVRLHYVDEGQGRPIVLLHGTGTLLQDFTLSILPDLVTRHRVIAFDRPGYGYSSRPQDRIWTPQREARLLRAALHRLGIERPVILGHSWGALVTMAYAILYPQAVCAAVLVSGFFYPVGRPDTLLLGLAGKPVIGPLVSRTVATPIAEIVMPVTVRGRRGLGAAGTC